MKLKPKATSDQPEWVCDDCGAKFGKWWVDGNYVGPSSHCATYHAGECDVCGQVRSVTEPRDFGYLRSGWA